jgi:4-aminobutyrate aminotransferase-like enzyme
MGDVRGRGLMVAVEFTMPDGARDAASAARILQGCIAKGLLLLSCGTYKNVIRWIPPLVVTEAEIDAGLRVFEEALSSNRGC